MASKRRPGLFSPPPHLNPLPWDSWAFVSESIPDKNFWKVEDIENGRHNGNTGSNGRARMMSDPRHREQGTVGSHKGNPVPFSMRKSSPGSFLFGILRVESMAVNCSGHFRSLEGDLLPISPLFDLL
ncbi:hypothetical protein CEXT_87471 [Caerostris extrusa]|uniref:Uncharacterized protein n=1 Tax=Caerostris extrusa TaxID=172846 RepID=A0AAV4Y5A0_CAEEX|nr:hypothetical protein CEXT_87471 [Caerostris extrusa]